ncbi:hypothetical protein, partial [Mesorhizobium sp. M7A.F.Ca.AU.002.02.1.1]|uniref:hypothetical protein n=1 Tax=Mesorhizobium sp. M7A.F.Ca.AU.002.02.1.1 TaxID=2496671 RepID=UPI0019D2D2CE
KTTLHETRPEGAARESDQPRHGLGFCRPMSSLASRKTCGRLNMAWRGGFKKFLNGMLLI